MFRRWEFVLAAIVLVSGATGCRKPQPSTWPGIRQWNDRQERKEAQAASQPASENKPWWRFGRDRDATPAPAEPEETPQYTGDFGRAVDMVSNHQFAEAEQLLLQVIQEDPRNADAYRWLGDCYYNQLKLTDAIQAYIRARELDQSNYYALRGKGFAHLHYGHQLWREYATARRANDNETAQGKLMEAHENYKLALELLQKCNSLFPNDSEAMYGRAMSAEGASRKLYSNAVGLMRKGESTKAHMWAENCINVINEGIQAGRVRVNQNPREIGPRALVGGLFLRKALLMKEFDRKEQAVGELRRAVAVNRSILDDLDPGNEQAQNQIQRCEAVLKELQQEEAGAGAAPPPPPPIQ